MYKDVWKKFGVKIFIVLCSVLLVGGVAVAAPRLRADNSRDKKLTFNEIQQQLTASGSAITIKEELTYECNSEGEGINKLPTYLDVPGVGELVRYRDFDIQTSYKANVVSSETYIEIIAYNEFSKYGESVIDIKGSEGQTLIVKYSLKKRPINALDVKFEYKGSNRDESDLTRWVVDSSQATPFSPDDWDIYINTEPRITLKPNEDYVMVSAGGGKVQTGELGARVNAKIQLTNYEPDASFNPEVYKNINSAEITVDDTDPANPIVIDTGRQNLPLVKGTHYNLINNNRAIQGNPASYYVGVRPLSNSSASSFNPIFDRFVADYDDDVKKGSIEKTLPRVTNGSGGTTLTEGLDYVLSDYRVQSSGQRLDDATAGEVWVTFEGRNTYQGADTVSRNYGLRRNLEKSLNITLEKIDPNDQETYDKTEHVRIPKLSFSDHPDYELDENEYTVYYRVRKNNKTVTQWSESTAELKNAGFVDIKIVGKAGAKKENNPTTPGYYGTLEGGITNDKLSYEIKPLDVSNAEIHFITAEGVESDEFDVTCSRQDVIDRVNLKNGNGYYSLNEVAKESDNDFEVTFYKDAAHQEKIQETEWGSLKPGTYYGMFDFHGNLDGDVNFEFVIREYKENLIVVELGDCPECADSTNHIYSGEEHRPAVKSVTYQGSPVSYTKDYANNINVSEDGKTASVLVTVGNVTKTVPFRINPRSLSDGKLDLTSKGFEGSTDARTHEYCGQNQGPEIPTLNLLTNDGKDMPLKQPTDYTVLPGIYEYGSASTRPVAFGSVNKTTKYCFRIQSNSLNFENGNGESYVETVPFTFTARSLESKDEDGKSEITGTIQPRTEYKAFDETEYQSYIQKNIVVTDSKFNGEKLRNGIDFIITEVKDNLSGDGSVTFTIEGQDLYDGFIRQQKLMVGTHIRNVYIWEDGSLQGQPQLNGSNEEPIADIWLNATYTTNDDPDNPFSVQFNETTGYVRSKVNVCSTSSKEPVIAKGTQYKVDFDEKLKFDEKGNPYASAYLKGISGYYGEIEVKFHVDKINIKTKGYRIEIVEPDSYVYTGFDVQADIRIYDENNNEVKNLDDFQISYTNCKNATLGYVASDKSSGAIVSVTGKPSSKYVSGGVSATITEHYNVKPRPIWVLDSNNKKVLNTSLFRETGIEARYPYRPQTTFSQEDVRKGVWPKFEIEFDHTGNFSDENKIIKLSGSANGDYNFDCTNNQNVTTSSSKAKLTITARGNFEGEVDILYDITSVDLGVNNTSIHAEIKGPDRQPFSGKKYVPEVTIWQNVEYENGQKEQMPVAESDYTIEYVNTLWVSTSSASGMDSQTCVRIRPKPNASGTNNYEGFRELAFTVYGELSPAENTEGIKYSTVVPTIQRIPYSDKISYDNFVVVDYYEKRQDCTEDFGFDLEDTSANPVDKYLRKRQRLTYGSDYTISSDSEIIGIHSGYINAGTNGFFVNPAKRIEDAIVIYGDLKTQATVTWKRGTAAVPLGENVQLDQYITVECGGRVLDYGTDYVFNKDPLEFTELGKTQVVIKPSSEAAGNGNKEKAWLEGELPVEFNVIADITDDNVTGLLKEYEYTGLPVIDPKDIVVTINGNVLKRDTDYEIIGIQEAVNAGTHTITIRGKSAAYAGSEISYQIKINPYDISKHDMTIRYGEELSAEPTVVFTGKTVLPNITKLTAPTSAGSITLTPGDGENAADYEVRVGEVGDHINWTNPRSGKPKPTFVIAGVGNFQGEIKGEYVIEPRSITEAVFDKIEDQPYENNRPITPIPTAKYGTLQLVGIPYNNSNANDYLYWGDNDTHFTYEYASSDLGSIGSKTIRIRGIGNFTGEVPVSYQVIALDIELAELVFKSQESPVYDGRQQKPAFELRYKGDVILEWTGTQYISDNISTASIEWDNNINASTDENGLAKVMITLAPTGDNYFGTKSRSFTILPASLKDHVKFMYMPIGQSNAVNLNSYQLKRDFEKPGLIFATDAQTEANLLEDEIGIYYDYPQKANHNQFLGAPGETENFTVERMYVEPDTDDVEETREGYTDKDFTYAGKVKYTITGTKNYADSATFWYFIGTDISDMDTNVNLSPTTTVFNSQLQKPNVTVTGLDVDQYTIAYYRGEPVSENRITDSEFINAATYYIRIEGRPSKGTYASKPKTLTYTITPRAFSNNLVIDGFKREYSYTGYEIRPVGISVTDYIDNVKYKLTEDVDYVLTYTNNLNAGTAHINVKGQNNFNGSATASFMITSSTISSGGTTGSNSFLDQGTGEISGATAVSPSNVNMSMDTLDAMYYTGNPVYPKISIAGMTENVDYTVTFSNNVEVGTAVATISGIGNNTGTITKNFRIIAQLSKCTISPIPAQQYTGSEVKPSLTVRCGNSILMEGTDYTVTYANNVNIGTATATIRALNNANYTGTASVKFSIGNDVGGFIISGYAPSYAYTGKAITPGVVVETGSKTLIPGTDYTVSYSNNVNAGTATITVTGIGRYSGTQTANFIIEPKSMQSLDTTEIADRTYTGDAYTPDITVSDGGKVLTKGVDYTVTYTNNTNPGMASILIQGTSSNYTGTKVVSFKISAVAVKGLKASNVKYNSLKLRWTKQGYADGYQICDSKSKLVKTVKTNSATITGLTAGKTYKYKVRSYIRNADGTKSYGAFSSVLNATTKLRTPTVKVVSNAKGQARISWSKVSGASGYEIYYKKTSGAKYKRLKTVNNPNVRVCTVRGMKSGDRAYFRVRAFRKNGSKKVYSALNPLKVITVK